MSLDIFRLDGRVALITGSSRGLGLAMAQAGAGASVVINGRRHPFPRFRRLQLHDGKLSDCGWRLDGNVAKPCT